MAEMYSLIAEKTRSPNLRYRQGWFLLKTPREKLSHVLPVPCLPSLPVVTSIEFLAGRHITPVSASLFPLSLLRVTLFLSPIQILSWDLGPTLIQDEFVLILPFVLSAKTQFSREVTF